jgi:hypothetical protein
MLAIEAAKVSSFIRVARRELHADPSLKIAICLNYTKHIERSCAELSEFNPVVLDGRVPMKSRLRVLNKFQEPSCEHRLLIGNVSVCSTGIDLDDKHGGFHRKCLASPNYSVITLYQLSHRFLRMDTRSDSTLWMLYAKHAHEIAVLNALSRKTQVMKETTTDQVEQGVVFPGDFEALYENGEVVQMEVEG